MKFSVCIPILFCECKIVSSCR